MRRRLLRRAVPVVVMMAAVLPAPADAAASSGLARFGHFAPSVAPVDIFVDGEPFASGIGFKQVSSYAALSPGLHRFDLKFSSDPDGPVIFTAQAGVPADGAITIGAVSTREGVASQVYDDALGAPAAGRSSVRFVHAVPDFAAIDVQVAGGGPVLAANVPYPAGSAYQDVAPGTYDVEVRPSGSSEVVLRVAGWTIEPGVQSSVVVVQGLDGALDVVPIVDSAATAETPAGGVQTGYGGMAPPDAGGVPWAAVALVGASVLAAGTILGRRRHARPVG